MSVHGKGWLTLCASVAGAVFEEPVPPSDSEGAGVTVCPVPEGGQPPDPVPPPEWPHEGSGLHHFSW